MSQLLANGIILPALALYVLLQGLSAFAADTGGLSGKYVPGTLIVKYSSNVRQCVHCLIQQGRSFESATPKESSSLDRLHSKYGVQSAEPLFRHFSHEKLSSLDALRWYERSQNEAMRRKFPNRTRRIPEGAVIPELYHIYLLTLAPEADILQAAADFNRDPGVVYAQPDYVFEAQYIPDDPYYSSSGSWGQAYGDLWGLKGSKLNLRAAWNLSQGENITVAVVDSGLDYEHPDIRQNVWINREEIPGNKRDDDGNGFVDDIRGVNFVRGPGQHVDDPMDDLGHGTHISGIIAAVGNNKLGVIGVAPRARIIPVKSLDSSGSGRTVSLGLGIYYAIANGADVINNSWGCSYCPSNPILEDVLRAAYASGVVVVFSAGNDQRDVGLRSPQNMTTSKPIVVAASTERDEPAYLTAFGAQVDLAAPGGGSVNSPPDVLNILSLRANHSGYDPKLTVDRRYLRLAGTSMSAPYVSGVAALLLAYNAMITNEEVRWILRASSKDIYNLSLMSAAGQGGWTPPKPFKWPLHSESR